MDKLAHLLTGSLMQVGGLLREIVYATMYVGINVKVLLTHGIKDAEWFLRGGSIIEIDQRSAVYFTLQNRKILAYFLDIDRAHKAWK